MDLTHMPDSKLLAMVFGEDVANDLNGVPLRDLFFDNDVGAHRVAEAEAIYMASPVIAATREIYARASLQNLSVRPTFKDIGAIKKYLVCKIGQLEHEVFAVMLVDASFRLVHFEEMFRGTLSEATVYPREVAKACLLHNAAAIVVAHNHPSGSIEPSGADMRLTKLLKKVLDVIRVRLVDHVIVGRGASTSFCERGLL